MKLVIVESPNKCKTIGNYLGGDYLVKASQGHLRDLSIKGVGGFGIEPDNDFKAHYEIDSHKYKIVNELRSLSNKADEVILATDPDREGEAIAWHLSQILGLDVKTTKRLEFHEITKESITKAIKEPRVIDMNLVYSQESRRIIDRVIGFKLSTVMQKKLKSPSAGRVQSATLKMICDHEDEINKFVPEEYWTLSADLGTDNGFFKINYYGINGKAKKIKNKQENDEILERMGHFAKVVNIETSTRKNESKLPFTTSSLQQEAFNAFGFTASKTASLAQKLYEGIEIDGEQVGLITYIRTDSTTLSSNFIGQATKYIENHFGKDYLGTVRKGKASKNAQEAHEAIRPTNVYRFPDTIKDNFKGQYDLYRLYKLIYQRSIASLMSPRVSQITSFTLDANGVTFKLDGEKEMFDGFTRLYKFVDKDQEDKDKDLVKDIPDLKMGEEYAILNIKNKQEFTTAPARYSEAKVVKLMEEKGIGRPSTYASTIVTLVKHKYVVSEKGIITPTEQGYRTNHVLEKYFPEIVDVNYTADMETKLDKIEDGKETRTKVLEGFYEPFITMVDKRSAVMYKDGDIEIGRNCPVCGKPLVLKSSPYGEFVGCSNYPTCKYKETEEKEKEYLDELCPECGSRLVYRKKGKSRFIGCSNYPTCKYVRSEVKTPKIIKKCPECGGDLIEKTYKGHKYAGCSNYPTCRYTEKIAKNK